MPKPSVTHDRDVTTLSYEQRDWIRRQGRLARALEAAQRRAGNRFVRGASTPAPRTTAGGPLSRP
jgi:hypothetical protein